MIKMRRNFQRLPGTTGCGAVSRCGRMVQTAAWPEAWPWFIVSWGWSGVLIKDYLTATGRA